MKSQAYVPKGLLSVLFPLVLLAFSFANAQSSHNSQLKQESVLGSNDVDSFHYVFIGGYGNEKIPGYFDANIEELKDQGAKYVSRIMPKTENAILDNVQFIRAELLKLYQKSQEDGKKRRLAVLAHSKAAPEATHTVLRYADDFPPHVLALLVDMQGVLKGAPTSDEMMRKWDTSFFAANPFYWFNRLSYAGFTSMMTEQVKRDFAESARMAGTKTIQELSQRIYYWRSRVAPSDASESLKPFAQMVAPFGDNDGILPTSHMMLEELGGVKFGTDLGVVDGVDHLAYVVSGAHPEPSRIARIKEFTRGFLSFVLKSQSTWGHAGPQGGSCPKSLGAAG